MSTAAQSERRRQSARRNSTTSSSTEPDITGRAARLRRSASSPTNAISSESHSALPVQVNTPSKSGNGIAEKKGIATVLTLGRRTRSNNVVKQLFNSEEHSSLSSSDLDGIEGNAVLEELQSQIRKAQKQEEQVLEETNTCPQSMLTKKFLRKLESSGTLSNDRVFVAVSDVCEQPILGLFANVDFEKGEVVTLYGGRLRAAAECKKQAKTEITHVRRIPGSLFVRDGKEFSSFFKRDSDAKLRGDMQLPPSARVRRDVTDCPPEVYERIRSEGLGYMANTSERNQLNVKVVAVQQDSNGLYPCALAYVAIRDIKRYEEILAPYNNTESVQMKAERAKARRSHKKKMTQTKLPFAKMQSSSSS